MGQRVLNYSIWIAASPDQIWDALTEAKFSTQYFPNAAVESDWQPGSYYSMRTGDGAVLYDGKILEAQRPHLLVQTVAMKAIPAFVGHKEFTLKWVIEQVGSVSKLTIVHEGDEANAQLLEMLVGHCPDTASGIKTLLETGKPLELAQHVGAGG